MILSSLRASWRAVCVACCWCSFFSFVLEAKVLQEQAPAQSSAKESREQGPAQRIPRQQAQNTAALDGFVRDTASSTGNALPIPGAVLTLRNLQSRQTFTATSSAEGVFRLFPLPPGKYELHAEAQSYAPFALVELALSPNEVTTLEISLVWNGAAEPTSRLPRLSDLGPALPASGAATGGVYRELRHRLDADPNYVESVSAETL